MSRDQGRVSKDPLWIPVWCVAAAIAIDLLAWLRLLCLDGTCPDPGVQSTRTAGLKPQEVQIRTPLRIRDSMFRPSMAYEIMS